MLASEQVPGSRSYPLIGDLLQMDGNLITFMSRKWREHGDTFRVDFGPLVFHVVTHPDDVEHILKAPGDLYTRDAYAPLKAVLGEGLFMAEGELWKRNRTLMAPLFTPRSVEQLIPDVVASTDELLRRWEGRDEIEDLNLEMSWVTLRVITRTMFQMDMSTDLERLCDAIVHVIAGAHVRAFSPWLFSILPTRTNWRFTAAMRTIDEELGRLIQERRATPPEVSDLISKILAVKTETGEDAFDDEGVRDELVTIFLAGHETTAVTLTWAFHRLSMHPHWEREVISEVDQVLGASEPCTPEALSSMPKTLMFIHEVMRVHPPVWAFLRGLKTDDRLPTGKRLPEGAKILLMPYLTHRHPAFWENPRGSTRCGSSCRSSSHSTASRSTRSGADRGSASGTTCRSWRRRWSLPASSSATVCCSNRASRWRLDPSQPFGRTRRSRCGWCPGTTTTPDTRLRRAAMGWFSEEFADGTDETSQGVSR